MAINNYSRFSSTPHKSTLLQSEIHLKFNKEIKEKKKVKKAKTYKNYFAPPNTTVHTHAWPPTKHRKYCSPLHTLVGTVHKPSTTGASPLFSFVVTPLSLALLRLLTARTTAPPLEAPFALLVVRRLLAASLAKAPLGFSPFLCHRCSTGAEV